MEKKSSQSFWLLAFASTLLAVFVHGYLTTKFYGLRFGMSGGSSVCNINAYWNCDAVSASAFSQFLGIPMALWGAVTNFILAIFLLMARWDWFEDQDRGQRYAYWLTLMVILASLVMGVISITLVSSLCLFCVVAYALSLGSWLGTWRWARPEIFKNLSADLASLFTEHKGTLAMFIAVPGLTWLGNAMILDNYKSDQVKVFAAEKISQWQTAPMKNFDANAGLSLFKGSGTPVMQIVEFADFRCPHCKEAYLSLDSFAQSHPDVQLIFKYFPLDGTCNPDPKMEGQGDGISCEAAFVTHCAEKLSKKGWEAHHLLFEKQSHLHSLHTKEDVRKFVCEELSLNCEELKVCAESEDTRNSIQATSREGSNAEIHGTPSIYVNGRLLGGGQLLPILEQAYQALKNQ